MACDQCWSQLWLSNWVWKYQTAKQITKNLYLYSADFNCWEKNTNGWVQPLTVCWSSALTAKYDASTVKDKGASGTRRACGLHVENCISVFTSGLPFCEMGQCFTYIQHLGCLHKMQIEKYIIHLVLVAAWYICSWIRKIWRRGSQ